MKQINRLLSFLLTLAVLIGMMSVCSVGAMAEATSESLEWGPEELHTAAASEAVSLHSPQIVGMSMAPGGKDWYMVYGMKFPFFDSQGAPIMMSGDEITMTVHTYDPDQDYADAAENTFVQLNLASNVHSMTENISRAMWNEAEVQYHPNYGYEYKEVGLTWTLPDDFDEKINQENVDWGLQIRVRGFNTWTTNLYYIKVEVNGEIVFEADGEEIFNSSHQNPDKVSAVEAPDSADPIAVLAKTADFAEGGDILKNLGGELEAGNYEATVTLSNYRKVERDDQSNVTNPIPDEQSLVNFAINGPETPVTQSYTKEDVFNAFFMTNTHRYDTVTIPFTMAADGTVDMTVSTTGWTDVYISNITIERVYTREERDTIAVNEAIAAIGTVTEENYEAVGALIQTAETAYNNFVTDYGQEKADAVIVGVADMQAARTEYDRIVAAKAEEAKQAAIAAAEETITAIGSLEEFAKENVEEKQALVDAANAKVQELIEAYGEDITSEVENYADIAAAQAKIDEIKAVPEFTYGKVNDDDKIDASDALMALQHSVELVKLEGNAFSAANVNADDKVDAADALLILQYSVELIEKFPAEQTAE